MNKKRRPPFLLRLVVPAAALLAAVALGSPHQAHAYGWSTVTVDAEADVSSGSIAVDANGDPMISYQDATDRSLKFATCDMSATGCDASGDWTTKVAVDSTGTVGLYTSIAVDGNGDPMISYHDYSNQNLKFAICDRSESIGGNCDQTADWSTVTVDAEGNVSRYLSLALNDSGDPMISYFDFGLKFAICD
ncbi:unnamed protein product, partial [marine sediment metagenome]